MTLMNAASSHADRPRVICRLVRQWCVFNEHRPAHAKACPDCRAYFQAVDAFENTLRSTAVPSQCAAVSPPGFESTIMRAVRNSTSRSDRSSQRAPTRPWMIGALSGAAAIAAMVLSLNTAPPSRPQPLPASPTPAEDAVVILNTVESLSTGLVDTVIPSAGQFVAGNPLQQELGYVYSDVRSALDFLGLNFLPTSADRLEEAPLKPGTKQTIHSTRG